TPPRPCSPGGNWKTARPLSTIRDALTAVPDQPLLDGLHAARGRGRDDYPVTRLWRGAPPAAPLPHPRLEGRPPDLPPTPPPSRLIGLPAFEQTPHCWTLSRSLDVLGPEPHLTALRQVFDYLARPLGEAVPDLGRHTVGDATALGARAKAAP